MEYIQWNDGKLVILDQTKLPLSEEYLVLETCEDVARSIKEMRVRGAPIIGIAAAYGLALAARHLDGSNRTEFLQRLDQAAALLKSTRPTAVNLAAAIERMLAAARQESGPAGITARLLDEAHKLKQAEEDATRMISEQGAALIQEGFTILTHCNAGALATSGRYGTALGVIKAAHEQGKNIKVLADETRPLLQGARLTAWELAQAGIDVTLITDSMAGYFMSQGKVGCVIVGADRIARNGDVANKIGTYSLAVLAKENRVPFYVAAPSTSFDLSLASGKDIPIEYREASEITHLGGAQIAPAGVQAANPAFDVTPHRYVSAIITEKGVCRRPYRQSISRMLQGA